MILASAKQFHDEVTKMLRSHQIVAVTKHGKIAGYFLPHRTENLPRDVRWRLFDEASRKIKNQLKEQGVTEEEILKDFEHWRKEYRSSRSRR